METVRSRASSAYNWITGNGAASEQAVKEALWPDICRPKRLERSKSWVLQACHSFGSMRAEAQKKVEDHGGKIVMSTGFGRTCIDHKGYKVEDWPKVVPSLVHELGLSMEDPQAQALVNAHLREEGKGQHFNETNQDNQISLRYCAYNTVNDGTKIDVLYGKHEETMEVSGAAASLPSGNCIQYDGTTYAVWPLASGLSACAMPYPFLLPRRSCVLAHRRNSELLSPPWYCCQGRVRAAWLWARRIAA